MNVYSVDRVSDFDVQSTLGRMAALVPPQVTLRQLAILWILDCHPDHTLGIKSIVEKLGLSKPSVCRALDAFERERFASRRVVLEDRRNLTVGLLPAGRSLILGVKAVFQQPSIKPGIGL